MNKFVLKTSAFRLSDEEFFNFCRENRELRIEKTASQDIIIMPPTGYSTGYRNSEIIRQLANWNKQAKAGRVVDSSTGFTLPGGAVRSPDAAWISNKHDQHLTEEAKQKFAALCPDFVIELKSNSDSLVQLQDKMREWIDNGCQLAWLIDPAQETVYVYQPNQAVTTVQRFSSRISGEPILPGFELILADLRSP